MNRRQLIKHLKRHNCKPFREGGKHSIWISEDGTRKSAVPRHTEIVDLLAKVICADLNIPWLK